MQIIKNYILGSWQEGSGDGTPLYHAVSGKEIARATTQGLDFKSIVEYGRTKSGVALRSMTFHDRALRLKALAMYLNDRKAAYYTLSAATGATKADSWVDIDGGISTMFVFASKGRRELPNDRVYVDGKAEMISKQGTFIGQHIRLPLEGVAIHINAFNFPVWGMMEKIAVNLLAGMPAIIKPATSTCYLTELVVRDIIASSIFPEGSIQLICGSAGDLLDHVTCQDVVTFTGSASTGRMLKQTKSIINNSVRFNMEADSLNCSILGPDATPDTEEFAIFIKEVLREMTSKAGQKCTAIRRVIVPEHLLEDVSKALSARLQKNIMGDPAVEGVRMGPLASKDQVKDVRGKVELLLNSCEVIHGHLDDFEVSGADKEAGAFFASMLLRCNNPLKATEPHTIEAFGPVSTLLPYADTSEAIALARKGEGSLVASVISADDNFCKDIVLGAGSMHGRIVLLNRDSIGESTGHGSPLAHLIHGGPGRAGGGEEMGGIRGVFHFMQQTALQGSPTTLTRISNVYMPKAKQPESLIHPFRKMFDDLEIGETLVTHKRTVTEADIVNFANISGDNFYAHMDVTSLEGTLFESRVAHGYFILSAAAGLFVDPKKGPVLANYGLDECRFIKPVYVGATIGVRLTVKEKVSKEKREGETPQGVVKWQVDVYDETGETVALATILTLVQRKDEEAKS